MPAARADAQLDEEQRALVVQPDQKRDQDPQQGPDGRQGNVGEHQDPPLSEEHRSAVLQPDDQGDDRPQQQPDSQERNVRDNEHRKVERPLVRAPASPTDGRAVAK